MALKYVQELNFSHISFSDYFFLITTIVQGNLFFFFKYFTTPFFSLDFCFVAHL